MNTYEEMKRRTLRDLFAAVITVLSFASVCVVLNVHNAIAAWTGIETFRFVDPLITVALYAIWLLAVFIMQRLRDFKYLMKMNDQISIELTQARKLSALGNTVCGIAHDFNNVLAVLKGMVDITLCEGCDSEQIVDRLKDMQRAVDQSDRLVRQLMDIGKNKPLEIRYLDVNSVINHMDKVIKHIAGQYIDVNFCLAQGIEQVRANMGQIEEIILNLVTNACKAIQESGRLDISTTVVEVEKGEITEKLDIEPGRYIELKVRDNGKGIDPDLKERIFEPFFTGGNGGDGIGLANTYSIVRGIRGAMECESVPDSGTCFKVYLPIAA